MLKNKASEPNLKKSERTRQHLMVTALREFESRGYDACTMRDLAKVAGVTAPAFYYYFRSKEEIVSAFYADSLQEHLTRASAGIDEGGSFEESLRTIILQRFDEFSKHREALRVLKRFAFDRDNALSPFHIGHKSIRKDSVDLFQRLLEKSKLKLPSEIQREAAQLLWFFHLAILFYWIGDSSPGQRKTKELLERSLSHLSTALFLMKLPGAQKGLKPVFETLKRAGLLEKL